VGIAAGGGDSGTSLSNTDVTITSAFLNLRQRSTASGFFSGVGLGVGQSHLGEGSDKTRLLVAGELGYSLRPDLYLVGRYETSSEDVFRALTVGIGLRF